MDIIPQYRNVTRAAPRQSQTGIVRRPTRFQLAGTFLALLLLGAGCCNWCRGLTGRSETLNDGLVAHWTFDEGGGTVAKDVTGHGHDAALKNVEWAVSPRGHAACFTSKDSVAQYGNRETMNLSGDMTLAVWVRTDGGVAPNTHRLIFGDVGSAVVRNANLALDSHQRLSFEWGDGKSTAALFAPVTLLNGPWKHVAAVADSKASRVTLYVDGVNVAEMPMPLPISKTTATERVTGWFYNGFFQGDLDDIRLYSRALAADEVRELFQSQADIVVDPATLLCDAFAREIRGVASINVRNLSQAPRRLEVNVPDKAPREITIAPGEQRVVALEGIPLKPIFAKRDDLYQCDLPRVASTLTIPSPSGNPADTQVVRPALPSVCEPLQVVVRDPWQAKMSEGKTERVAMDVTLAILDEQVRDGTLRACLASRETGTVALSKDITSPQAKQTITLDVRELPWGAYDLSVSFLSRDGREVVTTKQVATILPGGSQQIRVLNNLVSELMDARSRGMLGCTRIEFMNPRQGWVWLRAAGACAVALGGAQVMAAEDGKPAVEAMRLLPAGKHVLEVSGKPTDLTVRSIPYLVYNVYPSTPRIAPFGENTWERLKKHMLPNVNMIESPAFDTPESREWQAQGKLWIRNVQAPGLLDEKPWTVESMMEVWLNPGKPTAHAEIPGLDVSKVSGVQVDEYYVGAKSTRFMEPLTQSIMRLAKSPAFAGKLWIPFLVRYGALTDGQLFMRTLLATPWPFSEEVYIGEMPTEAENLNSVRSSFLGVASAYEKAFPGSLRRMIFTPMYAYLPYCTTNRCPQADFRVHLDMQMRTLATDPAFFGLGGVQPYRSNYVNEEILTCRGKTLRHYAIDGKTERMVNDPYELRHVANPDFEEGASQWDVTAAEEGAVTPGTFAGYGNLTGRYPASSYGDTFMVMKRGAKAANVLSQEVKGLTPGRLYSLKVITGDYADLRAGKSRNAAVPVSIAVDGAAAQPGDFSQSFPSNAAVKAFTATETFWMTYHYLTFRATGPTARLSISDWLKPDAPDAPLGQEVMVNFVELQPVMEE